MDGSWVGALLGGSAAATVVAVFQGIKMFREQTSVRTARAIKNFERWRDDATKDAEWYQDIADYWRECYAELSFTATQAGVTLPARKPLPERPVRNPEA